MKNGLSGFNSSIIVQSKQLVPESASRPDSDERRLSRSYTPSIRGLAAKLCAAGCTAGLIGISTLLPVQAQDELPILNPPAGAETPTGDSAVPEILPAAPAETGNPQFDQENIQIERDAQREGEFDSVERVPSLPPQTPPRFEDLLIGPNTAVSPSNLQPDFDGYHLGPGDAIFVSVQRYPDLSFNATLDLQGNIVVPIQGAVPFEGLTLAEAEDRLRLIYDQYVVIREPRDVSITLVGQRGVEVTILGSVQRPGFYPLADPSVAAALLTAGGATRTSDLRSIQVQRQIRRNGVPTEVTVDVDLFTPLKEGSALPDVRLEDGDVVVVPELDASDLDEYDRYLVAQSTLAQPVINVRFLNYAGGRAGIGTLNVNNGSTFLDAISLLGVNPDEANLRDVGLIRYDPETGRAVTINIDAKSGIRGDITQDPPLEDSDVIVVGRNLLGRLSFAVSTITRPFRDVRVFSNFIDDFINTDFSN
ncbi:MAG: polysaccharide biosynthesis/export family protein [Phormidesmis sp.]